MRCPGHNIARGVGDDHLRALAAVAVVEDVQHVQRVTRGAGHHSSTEPGRRALIMLSHAAPPRRPKYLGFDRAYTERTGTTNRIPSTEATKPRQIRS